MTTLISSTGFASACIVGNAVVFTCGTTQLEVNDPRVSDSQENRILYSGDLEAFERAVDFLRLTDARVTIHAYPSSQTVIRSILSLAKHLGGSEAKDTSWESGIYAVQILSTRFPSVITYARRELMIFGSSTVALRDMRSGVKFSGTKNAFLAWLSPKGDEGSVCIPS